MRIKVDKRKISQTAQLIYTSMERSTAKYRRRKEEVKCEQPKDPLYSCIYIYILLKNILCNIHILFGI